LRRREKFLALTSLFLDSLRGLDDAKNKLAAEKREGRPS
jgi:hypothetical protein